MEMKHRTLRKVDLSLLLSLLKNKVSYKTLVTWPFNEYVRDRYM